MNAPMQAARTPPAERANLAAHILDEGGTAPDARPLTLLPIDDQPMTVVPPQPVTEDSLIQFAMANGADLDYIQRLLDMRDRRKEEIRREAFFEAMAKFNAEDLLVMKNQHVEFKTRDGDTTAYDHADLHDVVSVIKPKLAKYGLSIRWKERVEGKTVWCTAIVRHALGYEEAGEPLPGIFDETGKKSQNQAMASTITMLRRYTSMGILGMSAKGQDDDGRAGSAEHHAQVEGRAVDSAASKPSHAESFASCNTIQELSRTMNGLSMDEKRQAQGAFNARRDELKRGAQ